MHSQLIPPIKNFYMQIIYTPVVPAGLSSSGGGGGTGWALDGGGGGLTVVYPGLVTVSVGFTKGGCTPGMRTLGF